MKKSELRNLIREERSKLNEDTFVSILKAFDELKPMEQVKRLYDLVQRREVTVFEFHALIGKLK